MAKASLTQAWLWHHRLSPLKFDTINMLSKKNIINGLPKLKYVKEHLCSSYEMGKAKRSNFKKKIAPSSKGQLHLLHMDLCGPMRSKLVPKIVPSADKTYTSSLQELELLFSPMFEEYFNGGNQGISKSSALSDNHQKYTSPKLNVQPTSEPSTPTTNSNAEENNTNQAIDAQFDEDEFINYHTLEQVRGNLSKPMQTRQQLATDPKMCMFALIVSTTEPKNIKEEMADHAWIKAMSGELHQFNRLGLWELVNKPFGKTVNGIKWLWENKKDEDNTVIRNEA
ncbi:retrovirus-related pol polyprotein from transposon TNT 1-94 [Tanacetum coccineum]